MSANVFVQHSKGLGGFGAADGFVPPMQQQPSAWTPLTNAGADVASLLVGTSNSFPFESGLMGFSYLKVAAWIVAIGTGVHFWRKNR